MDRLLGVHEFELLWCEAHWLPVNVRRKTMYLISGNISFYSWLMRSLVRAPSLMGLHWFIMPRYVVPGSNFSILLLISHSSYTRVRTRERISQFAAYCSGMVFGGVRHSTHWRWILQPYDIYPRAWQLDVKSIEKVHERILANYVRWCDFLNKKPQTKLWDSASTSRILSTRDSL